MKKPSCVGNKAQFDYGTYLIAVMLCMGILVSFGSLIGEISTNYKDVGGQSIDTTHFDATYNKIDQISSVTSSAGKATKSIDFGGTEAQVVQYGSVFSVFQTIFSSITLPIAMVNDMISDLNIPQPWSVIFPSLLVILFFSSLIYLIWGRTQ